MKKQANLIVTGIFIAYLMIGLGIDRYTDYKLSQTESFLEGMARDEAWFFPSHLMKILFWPFYL